MYEIFFQIPLVLRPISLRGCFYIMLIIIKQLIAFNLKFTYFIKLDFTESYLPYLSIVIFSYPIGIQDDIAYVVLAVCLNFFIYFGIS